MRQPPKPAEPSKANEKNEYIPSYISKAPFYLQSEQDDGKDYLEHQRLQSEKNHDSLSTSQWYDRGAKVGAKATKYRKGACENCGSMSHKEKDCLQRKRKKGARWTGKDIAADEKVGEVKLGWDAKRDRWNGFTAEEYNEVVEEYNALEELKKQQANGEGGEAADGDRYEAETDMGRQQATSTRNLRLREDTAKYLVNLDLDSAKYDPKTRSMLAPETESSELVAEDGFEKASGEAGEFESAQRYAWETQERGDGQKLHMQANPTEALLLRKRKADEDLERKSKQKKALLDAYGDQSSVAKPLPVAASSEQYVEYDARGRVKNAPEKKEKSMYAEDVKINNHTAVWGSWWRDFKWGYACCHSIVKNSFCTGEAGILASEESEKFSRGGTLALPSAEESGNAEVVEGKEEAELEEAREEKYVPNAVDRPKKRKKDGEEGRRRMEALKDEVDDEALEKYQREKLGKNDPMAAMLGRDELVS